MIHIPRQATRARRPSFPRRDEGSVGITGATWGHVRRTGAPPPPTPHAPTLDVGTCRPHGSLAATARIAPAMACWHSAATRTVSRSGWPIGRHMASAAHARICCATGSSPRRPRMIGVGHPRLVGARRPSTMLDLTDAQPARCSGVFGESVSVIVTADALRAMTAVVPERHWP